MIWLDNPTQGLYTCGRFAIHRGTYGYSAWLMRPSAQLLKRTISLQAAKEACKEQALIDAHGEGHASSKG